jgi:uncharacterized membrane protein
MNDYTFQEGHQGCRHRHGIVRTALMWAGIAVLAMLVLGAVTSIFGLVFGLAVLLIKIAIVTALVAFVWRRITRRRAGGHYGPESDRDYDRRY